MKKLRIAVLLVTVISLIGLLLACPTGGGSSGSSVPLPVPTADDYTITGTGEFPFAAGAQKSVTIEPKGDAPAVALSNIWYKKGEGTPTNTAPSEIGVYGVSFDTPAVSGKWQAATGLYAGLINILDPGLKTPVSEHYSATGVGVTVMVDDPAPNVSITAKAPTSEKSPGAVSIFYQLKGTTNRTSTLSTAYEGTYEVVFDVAAATGWNPGTNLFAGHIFVSRTGIPVRTIGFKDFIVKVGDVEFTAPDNSGSPKDVVYAGAQHPRRISIEPKNPGEAAGYPVDRQGQILLTYYQIPSSGDPVPIALAPINADKYKVDVLVNEFMSQDAAWSSTEFTLYFNITQRTPKPTDYKITRLDQSELGTFLTGKDHPVAHVSIGQIAVNKPDGTLDYYEEVSPGAVKIFYTYTGSETDTELTKWDGTKGFTVAEVNEWNTSILSTTPNDYKAHLSVAPPQKAGTYKVEFTVDAPASSASATVRANWGPAVTPPLSAGTLTLAKLQSVEPTFKNFWLDADDGIVKVSGSTTSGSTTTILSGDSVVFNLSGGGTVEKWMLDGKEITPSSPNAHTFTSTAIGWHELSVIASKDGKLYSGTFRIRVQPRGGTGS
jgi:hypothetical protein